MNRKELENMDEDRYMDLLEDNLWTDTETALGMYNGHTKIHYQNTNIINSQIARVIKENKTASGAFTDKDDALSFIQNAVSTDINKITTWIMSEKNEFDDINKYYEFASTVYMREATGIGYNNEFKELESQSVKYVLTRDYSNDSPYGFYLKTAYPDLNERHTKFTGRMFSKEDIINQNIYNFDSNYDKAAFLYNTKNGVKVYSNIDDNTHSAYLKITYKNDHNLYKVYIEDTRRRYFKSNMGSLFKRISEDDIKRECPQMYSVIKICERTIKAPVIYNKTLDDNIAEVNKFNSENTKNIKNHDKAREELSR